jgi:hypothetical protein
MFLPTPDSDWGVRGSRLLGGGPGFDDQYSSKPQSSLYYGITSVTYPPLPRPFYGSGRANPVSPG